MGLLKKILGKEAHEDAREVRPSECLHTSLSVHWDSLEDMGKSEKAVYRCEACRRVFTYEEARQFMDQLPPALSSAGRTRPHDDGGR